MKEKCFEDMSEQQQLRHAAGEIEKTMNKLRLQGIDHDICLSAALEHCANSLTSFGFRKKRKEVLRDYLRSVADVLKAQNRIGGTSSTLLQ